MAEGDHPRPRAGKGVADHPCSTARIDDRDPHRSLILTASRARRDPAPRDDMPTWRARKSTTPAGGRNPRSGVGVAPIPRRRSPDERVRYASTCRFDVPAARSRSGSTPTHPHPACSTDGGIAGCVTRSAARLSWPVHPSTACRCGLFSHRRRGSRKMGEGDLGHQGREENDMFFRATIMLIVFMTTASCRDTTQRPAERPPQRPEPLRG